MVGEGEAWASFFSRWCGAIQSTTVEEWERLWSDFSTLYPRTLPYFESQWIKPGQTERIVRAYTDQYRHFGVRVTSRAEGAHAYIKRFLGGKKTSTSGDLFTTWLKLEGAVATQISEIESEACVQRIRTPLHLDRELFQGCFGVVTWHALRLVQRHLQSAPSSLLPCTSAFTRCMELPCRHICLARKEAKISLNPSDFDSHWYWDHGISLSMNPLLNPLFAARQMQNNPPRVASTGRIFSSGEEAPSRKPPTCSTCGNKGHTRASRACPSRNGVVRTTSPPLQEPSSPTMSPGDQLALEMARLQTPSTAGPRFRTFDSEDLDPIPLTFQVGVQGEELEEIQNQEQILQEDPRPLAPNRPELLVHAYRQEKNLWLNAHLTVRPSEYRKARGWPTYRPQVLQEQLRFMPHERRDRITKSVTSNNPKWTDEEIYAWIDYERKEEDEIVKTLDAEYLAEGRLQTKGFRGLMAEAAEQVRLQREKYIV